MLAFPQELIDQVIDFWHRADPKGMSPCGLVCKRWLRRSRYHLFSDVSLDIENLPGFIDLIDTSTLPILGFVQYLHLFFASLDEADLTRLHNCPHPHLTWIELCRSNVVGGDLLPRVDWLESPEALQAHLRAWDTNAVSLSRLEIAFPDNDLPLRTVIDMISCVPALEHLVLACPSRLIEDTVVQTSAGPVKLVNLYMAVTEHLSLFLSWLLSIPGPPLLRHLSLFGILKHDEAKLVEAYFERAGGGLEYLWMGLVTPGGLFPR
ncbi:hypothetical protein C8R44DRAFT_53531 [Mycena epipterygia]|nr:hypothetical protein C8R44DRAFT_53531 [Mycena epipterygia]